MERQTKSFNSGFESRIFSDSKAAFESAQLTLPNQTVSVKCHENINDKWEIVKY